MFIDERASLSMELPPFFQQWTGLQRETWRGIAQYLYAIDELVEFGGLRVRGNGWDRGLVEWDQTAIACPVVYKPVKEKGADEWGKKRCKAKAGFDTELASAGMGMGLCWRHGGMRRRGKMMNAWLVMHAYAKALNVTPWDALLGQIRLLAGQVAWLTEKVGTEAEFDADLLPDGPAHYWAELLEERGKRLSLISKMAIDAGIAQQMLTLAESQAQVLHEAAKRTAGQLRMSQEDEYQLLVTLAQNYSAVEREHADGGIAVYGDAAVEEITE